MPTTGGWEPLNSCEQLEAIFHTPSTEAPSLASLYSQIPPHSQCTAKTAASSEYWNIVAGLFHGFTGIQSPGTVRITLEDGPCRLRGSFPSPARAAVSTVSPGNKSSRIGFVRLSLTWWTVMGLTLSCWEKGGRSGPKWPSIPLLSEPLDEWFPLGFSLPLSELLDNLGDLLGSPRCTFSHPAITEVMLCCVPPRWFISWNMAAKQPGKSRLALHNRLTPQTNPRGQWPAVEPCAEACQHSSPVRVHHPPHPAQKTIGCLSGKKIATGTKCFGGMFPRFYGQHFFFWNGPSDEFDLHKMKSKTNFKVVSLSECATERK